MPISFDQALAFHGQALSLRAQRQQVLAANIANADTPNYKAVDFDFNQALQSALGPQAFGVGGGLPLATTSAGTAIQPGLASAPVARTNVGHLPGANMAGLPTALKYRMPMQAALDANTVEMDVERGQFADNAVRYEASLRFLNGQIRTLQTAISGQGG